jgi:hypothetical protein
MGLVPGFRKVVLDFLEQPEQLEAFINLVSGRYMRIYAHICCTYPINSSIYGPTVLAMKTLGASSTRLSNTYCRILMSRASIHRSRAFKARVSVDSITLQPHDYCAHSETLRSLIKTLSEFALTLVCTNLDDSDL